MNCADCKLGVLFCYTSNGDTYLLATVPGGYRYRIGKGPLFRAGGPPIHVLRFNLHATVSFQEGLNVRGLKSRILSSGQSYIVCSKSTSRISGKDLFVY